MATQRAHARTLARREPWTGMVRPRWIDPLPAQRHRSLRGPASPPGKRLWQQARKRVEMIAADGANTLVSAALGYAARGWHVLPPRAGTKGRDENVDSTRLLPNGHKGASNDPDVVRDWWTHWPDANIGLSLAASDLVALDPDLYKPECAWHAFVEGKILPETLVQRSPRGGAHYVFTAEPGARSRASSAPAWTSSIKATSCLRQGARRPSRPPGSRESAAPRLGHSVPPCRPGHGAGLGCAARRPLPLERRRRPEAGRRSASQHVIIRGRERP